MLPSRVGEVVCPRSGRLPASACLRFWLNVARFGAKKSKISFKVFCLKIASELVFGWFGPLLSPLRASVLQLHIRMADFCWLVDPSGRRLGLDRGARFRTKSGSLKLVRERPGLGPHSTLGRFPIVYTDSPNETGVVEKTSINCIETGIPHP